MSKVSETGSLKHKETLDPPSSWLAYSTYYSCFDSQLPKQLQQREVQLHMQQCEAAPLSLLTKLQFVTSLHYTPRL